MFPVLHLALGCIKQPCDSLLPHVRVIIDSKQSRWQPVVSATSGECTPLWSECQQKLHLLQCIGGGRGVTVSLRDGCGI